MNRPWHSARRLTRPMLAGILAARVTMEYPEHDDIRGRGESPFPEREGEGDFAPPFEGEEGVERQLAQFAFVREEREREVRLLFRGASALEIARAFHAGGATLLTLAGERSTETTVRYFYAMRDLVYTVQIAFPTGVVDSIAPAFPMATRLEREVGERNAIVFISAGE